MHKHTSTRACRRERHNRERVNKQEHEWSSCPSNGGTAERETAGAEDPGTEEDSKGCKEDTLDRSRKSQEQRNKSRPRCNGENHTSMSRNCSACGKDAIGMTTKAGGLTRECAPRQDMKKWSTSVATRCTRESAEKCANARRRRHPSRQDGRRRAREVGREGYKTHARPALCASTPPLEALKVVLSEIAKGERGGKFVALVDVRRAYFHASAR